MLALVSQRATARTGSRGVAGGTPLVGHADPENQAVSMSAMLGEAEAAQMQKMLDLMLRIDVFKDIPRNELPKLAHAFTTRVCVDGELIVRQGDPGNELFFIQDGAVVVKTKKSEFEPEIEVATLQYGKYFGETALLTDAPRNASVHAKGDGVLLRVLTREQFVEHGLQSKMKLQVKYDELNQGLAGSMGKFASFKNLAKLVIVLGLYLGLSVFIFHRYEGWDVTDCAYFAIVTFLTVGYGDKLPQHSLSKLYVVIFVVVSLLVLAAVIGDFLESLVTAEIKNDKAKKALNAQQKEIGIFDKAGKKKRIWRRLFNCLCGLVALIGANMLIAYLMLEDAKTPIECLYFAIVTLTTIGFGDIVPHTDEAKWAVMLMCLVGVPLFGLLLAQIVDVMYGRARSDQIHTVVGGLTTEKFDGMIEFCDSLVMSGAYNSQPQESRRDQITPFEFLCFIAVKNDTMSVDEIKAIMANFSELDPMKHGMLDKDNLDEWQQRGSRNAAGSFSSDSDHRSVSSEIFALQH